MQAMLYSESCKARMAAACRRVIDEFYTPAYQERVFVGAIQWVCCEHVVRDA